MRFFSPNNLTEIIFGEFTYHNYSNMMPRIIILSRKYLTQI